MGNCRSQQLDGQSNHLPAQVLLSRKFNPFYQPNTQNTQQQTILAQYNFHSNYDDKFLGRCSILQHKQSKNFYLSKQIAIASDDQYEHKLHELLQIQQKLTCENIIQIKHIIEKQFDGFFTQSKKIIVIVDYPLTNMEKELKSRMVGQLGFSKEEIVNVVISCVKAYAMIERNSQEGIAIFRNDKVRLRNIFFGIKNKQTLIKVPQSSLLSQQNNLKCIFANQHNVPQNRDIYLAPEQFQAYLRNQKNTTYPKAGVFSLGMSVLDLCTMTSSREVYSYDERLMDFNEIRNRVLIAGKKYGAVVERFLNDMLESNDRVRLTFEELEKKIPSLLMTRNQQEGPRMNLSVARSNSIYLRNSHRSIRQSMSRSRASNRSSRSRSNSRSTVQRANISSNYSSLSVTSRYNSKIGRRMRGEKQDDQQLEKVHQIYDKNIGRQYIGQKKGNFKHGEGKYQFEKGGAYYEGQWKNNKMDGKGESYFRQGELQYSGEWKDDEYHGWGILYSNPDSDSKWVSYQGEFKNGVKQGRGQLKFKDSLTYDGEFRGDKIHGRGKVIQQGKVIIDSYWELCNPETFLQDHNIRS